MIARIFLMSLMGLLMACSEQSDHEASKAIEAVGDEVIADALPFGSWPSIITAASLVEGSRGIGGLTKDGEYFYWLESRPEQGGRTTIMRWQPGSEPEEILDEGFNVRTRVQEYGGGSLLVHGGVLWFSNFSDQRLYRLRAGEAAVPITPETDLRYAGCSFDRQRERLLCIREDHRGMGEPVNALVALSPHEETEGTVLFSRTDFVSAPRLSPDGKHIAFVSWMHPNMPWDSTTLHSASFDEAGMLTDLRIHNPKSDESVIDPQWRDDNTLIALSDRDNWWKPYRVDGSDFTAIDTGLEHVEIGGPAWTIGGRYYWFLPDGSMVFVAREGSVETLMHLDKDGKTRELPMGAVSFGSVVYDDGQLYFTAGFADKPAALLSASLKGSVNNVIRRSSDTALDVAWVPQYEQVAFPLPTGGEAYGVYFAPKNPNAEAIPGTAPPLIVSVHGGPTSVAGVSYRPEHYYWTSRGFAVLDLNYRGSTGFGREYRRALYGQWGISDVEDAAAGATWLAEQGLADADRLIIRGGSAGGYTTLAVHAFYDAFAAGASYYGVSDIEALAEDTHKFESRYLDQLVGPYPERKDLYVERSPIHHLDGFKAPLLLLQGLDDPIVPPNQSEMIYDALKSSGVPTAYLAFEGESHGFRKAENQIAAREAELYFYARVLGLNPADELPEILIDNLD
ncbi:S9 family peptidase [Congregibacter litoralis]|uniref:Dipeptidyl aminopeptidases/acylaminoacyl-peptidase n=1 Tax=Congregibacter litoralis KT71 TaxID=314285 RepID=A4ADA2_9GAMM|nr:S9 family peptidase [Congregibacter litoralis]EAQ96026.2 Dipeptidyl aminopeptidases/acylaminoacyl-peptidase [Congregibacter litoralis KT71]